MTMTVEEILSLLREVFSSSLPERKLPGDEDPLFGQAAKLDSMELVGFVADVEDTLNERFSHAIILADERALSRSRSPFRSLRALAEYIEERLRDG